MRFTAHCKETGELTLPFVVRDYLNAELAKYDTWEEAKKSHLINLLGVENDERTYQSIKSRGVGQTTMKKPGTRRPKERTGLQQWLKLFLKLAFRLLDLLRNYSEYLINYFLFAWFLSGVISILKEVCGWPLPSIMQLTLLCEVVP